MNLSQLEVLVAIVDTGSLTDAADVVGLTQSAVSYSLSRLEAELGVTLLERGRQGVRVTAIGEDVLQHARTILTQTEIIRQKTNRERGLSVGKIRFGVVPNIAGRLLTGILRDFQHKFPEIEIVLYEGTPHEILEWLETDLVDVGAVLNPTAYTHTVAFASGVVKVILPKTHERASHDSFPMDALADYPLIGPKSQYRMFHSLVREWNLPLPQLRYEVSAFPTILTMVREGLGISMMPDMLYDADSFDGIVKLPFEPLLQLNIYLVTYADSPVALAFMKNSHQWSKEHGFLE
ncbi:MAG: LysR family transcriptional regulator [Chloroflexota bacterium]